MMFYKIEKLKKIISWTMLCIILTIVVYVNFKKIQFNIDTDIFAEMNYGKEVWVNKTLFPMTWFPAQELMFFRPTIIYVFIYGIIKKYILSYSISLVITLGLIITSYIYMLKAYKYSNNIILLSVLLLLSFDGDSRSFVILNFMMYGYYGFYTVSTFFTIGVIQRIHDEKKLKKKYIYFIYFIAFISGLSGIRMIIFLYIPLLVSGILNWYINIEKKMNNSYIHIIFLSIINAIGIIISKLFFYYTIAYRNEDTMKLSVLSEIKDKLWDNIISAIYMVLGSNGGMELKSFQMIDMILKGILFLSVLFFLYKNRRRYTKNMAVLFFISYFIVIFGIKTLTNQTSFGFSWYYYLVPCLFSLIICDISKIIKYKNKLFILLIGICISNIFANSYPYFDYKEDTEFSKIIDYLNKNKVKEVATFFGLSGKVWAYSNGEIKVGHWNTSLLNGGNDIKPIYWLGNSTVYDFKHTPTYVIIDADQEKILLNKKNSKLYVDKAEKVYQTPYYKIYKFETNPLAEFRMPRKGEKLEFPPNKVNLLAMENGYTKDNNSIITKGKEGYIFYGPYIYVEVGTYNIEFEYKTISNNINKNIEMGYIEVVSHDKIDKEKTIFLSKEKILSNKLSGKIILKNIKFHKADDVEIRAYGLTGYKFEISKMIITRVK